MAKPKKQPAKAEPKRPAKQTTASPLPSPSKTLAEENEETLARLVTVLDYAEGFTLLFARCNLPIQRGQLIEMLKTRLKRLGIEVLELHFDEPVIDLRRHLRQKLADLLPNTTHLKEESKQPLRYPVLAPAFALSEERVPYRATLKPVLFLTGLEHSIPYDAPNARLLAELNLGREFFQRDAPLPILFWLPDYAITAVARHAPDFWSWQSGMFEFESEIAERYQTYERYVTDSNWSAISNLTYAQKLHRKALLESLLDDYASQHGNSSALAEQASIIHDLAMLYHAIGDQTKAIGYYRQAIVIDRKVNNRQGESTGLSNLGNMYADQGQMEQAIVYYQQALAIAKEIGDRKGEGSYLVNLGIAYAGRGEVKSAIAHYQQALAIAKEIGDRKGEGNRLGNLGVAYATLGQIDQSIAYYQQALAIAKEFGDRRDEGNWLNNLGVAYVALGQTEQAMAYYQQALTISRELGDRTGESTDLGNLGTVFYEIGEVQKAILYFQQALAISREIGDRHAEGNHLGNLGLIYKAQGNIQEAHYLWQQALKIFEQISSSSTGTVRQLLAEIENDTLQPIS